MISDIKRNVITTYKADTSDHKKAIGDLRDETKKLADENKKTQDAFEKFSGVAMKVTGVIAGAKLAFDSYKHSVTESRLANAAMGVDLEKLSAAAGGAKSRMQLLQEAAKFNASAFKLTSEQMVTAELAMRQLSQAGFEQEEVSQKVLDALVKLEGDGLKDFGIRVKEAKTDTEKFNNIMSALAGEASKVDTSITTQAESLAKMGAQFENTFDSIKKSIGTMVLAMQPLIEAVGKLASAAGPVIEFASGGWSDLVNISGFGDRDALTRKYGFQYVNGQAYALSGDTFGNWEAGGGTIGSYEENVRRRDLRDTDTSREQSRLYDSSSGARDEAYVPPWHRRLKYAVDEAALKYVEANKGKWAAQVAEVAAMPTPMRLEAGTAPSAFTGNLGEAAGTQWEQWQAEEQIKGFDLEKYTGASAGRLAKMFGPLEEFNGYTMAFQALQGAVGSALGAWIDGSSTAGEAVKKFIAESMKANAQLMAAEALKEGAYALSELAWGNVGKAAGHGASALKFGAAAAAFAIGAKAMHSGSSGSAGAAAPTYKDTARAEPERQDRIVVIGNAFGDDSPRQRQLWARRLVDQAMASGNNAVVYHS